MREIKFRWFVEDEFVYTDKITEYDFDCFITIENGEICLNCESGDDDFIGMKYDKADNKTRGQFTGLKDVNGVCIYEGDIVNFAGGDIRIVKYDRGCFWCENDEKSKDPLWKLTHYCDEYMVIGNIHQNHELLEK